MYYMPSYNYTGTFYAKNMLLCYKMNVYSDKVHSLLQVVAKQLDLTPREVERLVRDYKQRSLPSDIQKFNECG